MKRCFPILLLFLFACAVTAFSADKVKIGIIMQIDIPPFRAQVDGMKKGLEAAGYTKDNTEIIELIAAGKIDTIKGFTNDLRKAQVNLIAVIGSAAAIEVLKYVKDIPVVTSVTYAETLKENGKVFNYGDNYTASLMTTPTMPVIKLGLKIKKINSIGMVYNQNEDQSRRDVEMLSKDCKTLGIKSITLAYTDEKMLVETYKKLIDQNPDCVIISKDTLVVKHLGEIKPLVYGKKIVCLGLDDASATGDVSIVAFALDMSELGVDIAKKTVEILKGKKPADIPASGLDKFFVTVNLKAAKAVGINIPVEIIRSANKVIKE
jgi:putative ABC transport system substrate-binding protein